MEHKQVKNLVVKALNNGGATINKRGRAVSYKRGYQVSIRDCYKLQVKNADKIVKAVEYLLSKIKDNQFCGLWVFEGYVYIDISVRILDRLDAVIIGDRLNQKSIYDWKNADCIML